MKAIRVAGPAFAPLPNPVFSRVYAGFLLGGHDDRERWRESMLKYRPYYEREGGAVALVRQAARSTSGTRLLSRTVSRNRCVRPPGVGRGRQVPGDWLRLSARLRPTPFVPRIREDQEE
jgi:hypothetical protein